MSYKRSEIGKPDIKYGGTIMDISTFPMGTTFYVCNGGWAGKIVNNQGQKSVAVYDVGLYLRETKVKVKKIVPLYPCAEPNNPKCNDINLLSVSDVCYPKGTMEWENERKSRENSDQNSTSDNDDKCHGDCVNNASKNSCGDNGKESLLGKRYTMVDEHPCSFCDIGVGIGSIFGSARVKCPCQGMSDEEKIEKCRAFLYFRVLQEYENRYN